MTPRQKDVLNFVGEYVDSHGYSPSYREIADAIGLRSITGVSRIVAALLQQGRLTRERYAFHRSLRVAKVKAQADALITTDMLNVWHGLAATNPKHLQACIRSVLRQMAEKS